MTWFGVVLGGGGAKGEFTVGVLQALAEGADDGFGHFDFVGGVSVGALGAAAISQAPRLAAGVRALVDMWSDIEDSRDVYTSPLTAPGGAAAAFLSRRFGRDAIHGTRPLAGIIHRHLRWDRLERRDRLGGRHPTWGFRVVSLTDGQRYTVSNDPALLEGRADGLGLSLDPDAEAFVGRHVHDLLLASASQPVIFPPVDVLGHRLVDGGIRDLTPLGVALDGYRCHLARGHEPSPDDTLLLISNIQLDLTVLPHEELASGKQIAQRVIDILSAEIVRNDVRATARIDALARDLGPSRDPLPLNLVHVRPERAFGLAAMDFGAREARRLMRAHGLEKGREIEPLARGLALV